ncbi:MAG: type II toxin-antitoxin system RelE/ParE family toxin [Bacteroidota bacterium]|nr:type II toxin-antitoxin system RelE/ParE family toxin [Bacteroidota bacterium]
MYKIVFSNKALKSLKKITGVYQKLILGKLNELAINPFENSSIKALKGQDKVYRLRVADYRVIFTIDNGELVVLVIDINHRGNIYKKK